ncbi:MAG: hypothetical protein VX223_05835 [Myxococcota bacterium]|nr:hypothetical protein [Myxococcota bacterium]
MSSRITMAAFMWSLLLTHGCGPNPLVGEVEAMRDEMCACKDQDCAERVLKQLKTFDKENKGKKVPRKDNDTMQKLYGEVSDCLVQVSLKTREKAAEKAPEPTKEVDTPVKEDVAPEKTKEETDTKPKPTVEPTVTPPPKGE